jgi:hypothetical protein
MSYGYNSPEYADYGGYNDGYNEYGSYSDHAESTYNDPDPTYPEADNHTYNDVAPHEHKEDTYTAGYEGTGGGYEVKGRYEVEEERYNNEGFDEDKECVHKPGRLEYDATRDDNGVHKPHYLGYNREETYELDELAHGNSGIHNDEELRHYEHNPREVEYDTPGVYYGGNGANKQVSEHEHPNGSQPCTNHLLTIRATLNTLSNHFTPPNTKSKNTHDTRHTHPHPHSPPPTIHIPPYI